MLSGSPAPLSQLLHCLVNAQRTTLFSRTGTYQTALSMQGERRERETEKGQKQGRGKGKEGPSVPISKVMQAPSIRSAYLCSSVRLQILWVRVPWVREVNRRTFETLSVSAPAIARGMSEHGREGGREKLPRSCTRNQRRHEIFAHRGYIAKWETETHTMP